MNFVFQIEILNFKWWVLNSKYNFWIPIDIFRITLGKFRITCEITCLALSLLNVVTPSIIKCIFNFVLWFVCPFSLHAILLSGICNISMGTIYDTSDTAYICSIFEIFLQFATKNIYIYDRNILWRLSVIHRMDAHAVQYLPILAYNHIFS